MSDVRLRELERRWRETGDREDQVRYLQERLRQARSGESEPSEAPRELVRGFRATFQLIRAGIPLLQALHAVREDCRNEEVREVLGALRGGVSEGGNLSQVMARSSRWFPDHVCAGFELLEWEGWGEERLDSVLLAMELHADPDPALDLARYLNALVLLTEPPDPGPGGRSVAELARDALIDPARREAAQAVVDAVQRAEGAEGPALATALEDASATLVPPGFAALLAGVMRRGGRGLRAMLGEAIGWLCGGVLVLPGAPGASLREDLARFFCLLRLGLAGGVPFLESLRSIPLACVRDDVRATAERVRDEIEQGGLIADGLRAGPAAVPATVQELIRTFEVAGTSDRVLTWVAEGIARGTLAGPEQER